MKMYLHAAGDCCYVLLKEELFRIKKLTFSDFDGDILANEENKQSKDEKKDL